MPLGRDAIDTTGTNAGYYELASADELRAYYAHVMHRHFLPTGRVQYFPSCEYEGDRRFVSRLGARTWEVDVRRKIVDTTYLEGRIPATSPPPFEVASGVRCVPVGELARLSERPDRFVVIGAGILGWALSRRFVGLREPGTHEGADGPPPLISDDALHHDAPSTARAARIVVLGLVLWFTPVVLAALVFSRDSVYVDQGLFFSGAAVVTFGGAYAVLAYVAQQAVNNYHWLTGSEMVHGLALAETTPGPLIMVVQFVAFLGAYHDPGSLNPWVAAVLASLLTTWVTFVPSILFVVLGAPYVERLRANRSLSAALSGITAAVVGVIANLASWFTLHVLFSRHTPRGLPELDSVQWLPAALTLIALVLTFALRRGLGFTLLVCSALGAATMWLPG